MESDGNGMVDKGAHEPESTSQTPGSNGRGERSRAVRKRKAPDSGAKRNGDAKQGTVGRSPDDSDKVSAVFEAINHRIEHRGIQPPDDSFIEDRYPVLWSFLTTSDLGRKDPRVPSDFVVAREPGGYRITFRDHASFQKKVFSVLTLEHLFEDIEDALQNYDVPWQEYKSYIATDPAKKAKQNQ